MREQPSTAHARGGEQELLLAVGRGKRQEEGYRESDDPRRRCSVSQKNDEIEKDDEEAQQGLGDMDRGDGGLAAKKESLGQRNKMKDHSHAHDGWDKARQQFAAQGQQQERIHQTDGVED